MGKQLKSNKSILWNTTQKLFLKKEKAWDISHELLVGCPNNASKPLLVLPLVAQQLDCKILLKTRHTLGAGQ